MNGLQLPFTQAEEAVTVCDELLVGSSAVVLVVVNT